MKHRSRISRYNIAANKIRSQFIRSIQSIPGKPVKLVNTRDASTPSLSFTFNNDYVYREGVEPPDPSMAQGCGLVPTIYKGQTCRPNMGGECGCEYTRTCECLEYARINEDKLEGDEIATYVNVKQGIMEDVMGLPKCFPFSKNTGLLVKSYLGQRWPIYECNDNCACGPICKSRVVQKGRTVGLEIFRTKNRGWGIASLTTL
jgi:histone-lysine N-methyltransferase SUV39H